MNEKPILRNTQITRGALVLLLVLIGIGVAIEFYNFRKTVSVVMDSGLRTEEAEVGFVFDQGIADLRSITENPIFLTGSKSVSVDFRSLLITLFSGIMVSEPNYSAAKWIGGDGQELLRFEKEPDGHLARIPETLLHDQSTESFFRNGAALPQFQYLIATPIFDRKQGFQGQLPQAILRFIAKVPGNPLGDEGIIVLSYNLSASLSTFYRQHVNLKFTLVGPDGTVLSSNVADQIGRQVSDIFPTAPETEGSVEDLATWLTALTENNSHVDFKSLQVGALNNDSLYLIVEPTPEFLRRATTDAIAEALTWSLSVGALCALLAFVLVASRNQVERVRQETVVLARNMSNQEQYYREILSDIEVLLSIIDDNGAIAFRNHHFSEQLLGPDDENKPLNFFNLTHLDRKLVYRVGQSNLISEQTVINSRYYQFSFRLIPTYNQTERYSILCLGYDITDLVEAKLTLEEKNLSLIERTEQAELAAEAKSNFLSNMSHEIRTPLNGILGLLHVMENSGLDTAQSTTLNKITTASRALLNVLNDILDVSKLEAGNFMLSPTPVLLEDLVKTIGDLFDTSYSRKGLTLYVDYDRSLPACVVTDQQRLTQVLSNLVGNALKFTAKGGATLRVSKLADTQNGVLARFEVEDTGIGIKPGKVGEIFEKFVQSDASISREFGGTGLGLSISSHIAQLMGSQIRVESEVGRGSRFYFDIEMEESDQLASTAKPFDMAVFIVEEDQEFEDLARSLKGWGVDFKRLRAGDSRLNNLAEHFETQGQSILFFLSSPADRNDEQNIATALNYAAQRSNDSTDEVQFVICRRDSRQGTTTGIREIESEGVSCLFWDGSFSSISTYDLLRELEAFRTGQVDNGHGGPEARGASALRILIAEDNELNREVASALLEPYGHQLIFAHDGIQAVEAACRRTFDIILMDLHMPRMSGFEAIAEIRDRSLNLHVPIVALSAAVLDEDVARARQAGANDHIGKPIEPRLLIAAIDRLIAAACAIPDTSDVLEQTTDGPRQSLVAATLLAQDQVESDESLALLQRSVPDWSDLSSRFGGNETAIRKILDIFRQSKKDWPEELLDDALDREERLRMLHTLKGSAGTIGFTDLAEQARHAEALMKNDEEAQEAILETSQMLAQTLRRLNTAFKALQTTEEISGDSDQSSV